jgi:hypothetical protein
MLLVFWDTHFRSRRFSFQDVYVTFNVFIENFTDSSLASRKTPFRYGISALSAENLYIRPTLGDKKTIKIKNYHKQELLGLW